MLNKLANLDHKQQGGTKATVHACVQESFDG